MAEALLEVARRVGAAGAGGELARRQSRRDRDHAHAGRLDRRALRRAVGSDPGAEGVELLRLGDAVAEAEADHLGRVGDRAAAQGDDQVGAGLARRVRRRDDIGARRMRANLGADPGKAVAQHLPQPLDEIGLARERAARHHKDRTGIEAVDLMRQRFGIGGAEDNAFHVREAIGAAQHWLSPRKNRRAGEAIRNPTTCGVRRRLTARDGRHRLAG